MCLAALYMNIGPEEAITDMTINGAAALDLHQSIGSIDIGKNGDLIILEHPSYQFIPYHLAMNTVKKMIKSVDLVYDKTDF